jgi:hypothetical protein
MQKKLPVRGPEQAPGKVGSPKCITSSFSSHHADQADDPQPGPERQGLQGERDGLQSGTSQQQQEQQWVLHLYLGMHTS